MLKQRLKGIAACLATCITLACGENPLSDAAGLTESQVRFSIGGADTPLDVCLEADRIALTIAPEGGGAREEGQTPAATAPRTCPATFTVKVKKGEPVTFTGDVTGGERLLLTGNAHLADPKDGFDVLIDLRVIDALSVTTQTIGAGGPAEYTFAIDGSPTPRLKIGRDDTVIVPAVAARQRIVDLDPTPCSVVNGLAARPVGVPQPSSELGAVEFDVDCRGGVNVTTTGGTCTGTFDLWVDGVGPPISIGAAETLTVGSLGAGPHTFELRNLPSGAIVAVIEGENITTGNPATVDLPAGGDVDLIFNVTCTVVQATFFLIDVDVVRGGMVDPLGVKIDGTPVGQISDPNTPLRVPVNAGDHLIELTGVGNPGCEVVGGATVNPRTVHAPQGRTTPVGFTLECNP
jgi:hypothetical protein